MRFLCLLNTSWGFKRLGNNNLAYVSVPEALGLLWTVAESTKPGRSRKRGNSYYPLRSDRSLGTVTRLSRGSESSSALQDPLLSTLSSSRENAEFNGFSIMDIHTPLALLSALPRERQISRTSERLYLITRVQEGAEGLSHEKRPRDESVRGPVGILLGSHFKKNLTAKRHCSGDLGISKLPQYKRILRNYC